MLEMFPEIRHVAGGENSVADFLSRYQGMAVGMIDASPYRVAKLQELDEDLGPIKAECEQRSGDDPANTPAGTFFQIGKYKRQWCMRRDVLMLRITAKERRRAGPFEEADLRVAVPKALREEFIKEAHNSRLAGHFGEYKSLARISEKFWWPSMSKDVADHVAKCQTCQATTNKGKRHDPQRTQLDVAHGPNWRVHVDLFGPNKCRDGKRRFVLVMTDAFTKIVALRTIDDKNAATVARAMLESWCYTYGVPKVFVSDQGKEFTNKLADCLWKALDIDHRTTTPYHPQCNASAEVFNRTMKRYLAGAIMDAEKSTLDWPLYIAPLAFAYNTSVHKAAKSTPFATMFGYDPRVPFWDDNGLLDSDKQTLSNANQADEQADEYFAHKRAQADTRKRVMNNLQHAQEETKRSVERNIPATTEDFKAGDLVWVKIHQTTEANRKFAQAWEKGTIIERLTFSTYRVRRDERSRKKMATLNAQMLKPRAPTSAPATDSSDESTEDEDDATDDENEEEATDLDPAETAEMDMETPTETNVKAISYNSNGGLRLDRITPRDVIDLLNLGWTLTASSAIPGTSGRKPTTRAAPARGPAPSTSGTQQQLPPKMKRSALSKSFKHAKSKTKALFSTLKDAAKGNKKGTTSKSKTKVKFSDTPTETDPLRQQPLPPISEDHAETAGPSAPPAAPPSRAPPRANSGKTVKPSLPFSPGSWLLHKKALKRSRAKRAREEEEPGVPPTPSRARSLMTKRLKDHNSDPPGTRHPLPGEPRFRSTPKRLGDRFDRM
jgi:transposase InsO family protein